MSSIISFSKQLQKSHVSRVFRLPKDFCDAHLPRHDDTIVLVDGSEREFDVRYVRKDYNVCGGWKEFVLANDLLEGDTLVFELIGQCKFKVYVKSHQVVEELLTGNTRKRSPETYLVSPKGKIRLGMDTVAKLHCGKILRKVMNHAYGCIFSRPVDPVKLRIPDYFSVIKDPMDLGTIEKKLEGNRYSNVEEFADDVRLTFSNAMSYNPPDHEVHKWAKLFNDRFNKKWESLESKLTHQGPSTADDDGKDSRLSARTSCQDNENECEVNVHAGAEKLAGWKIRKMNSMVKLQCGNILRELMSYSSSWTFNEPVDPVKSNFPDYFSVIKEPMDLGTIKYKLDGNRYSNMKEFAADVRLTFSNAILYNPPNHEVYKWAEILNDYFNNVWKSLESKLKRQGPTTASDDGQDSGESMKNSCEGNKREWAIVVHTGAGKVHPEKMVEKQSKFAENNVQKAKCPLCGDLITHCCENDTPDQAFSSDLPSVHNICSDSRMMQEDRLCQNRNRVCKEMVPQENEKHVSIRRSAETNGADGNSSLSIHDSSNDAGIVKKESHEILDASQGINSVCMALSNQYDHLSNNISESVLSFKDVKGFQDFKIHSNGKNLDLGIPFQIQRKYYELCCTQKEFLHTHLAKGLNSKLVAEMIMEIISIAEATRAATTSTSFDQLEQMDKTLKFFEGWGMKVGFLRVRLRSLVKLSREHLTATKLKRTKLSLLEDERTTTHEEISKVDKSVEILPAREASTGSLEAEIDILEEEIEELDKIFRRVADSPWW